MWGVEVGTEGQRGTPRQRASGRRQWTAIEIGRGGAHRRRTWAPHLQHPSKLVLGTHCRSSRNSHAPTSLRTHLSHAIYSTPLSIHAPDARHHRFIMRPQHPRISFSIHAPLLFALAARTDSYHMHDTLLGVVALAEGAATDSRRTLMSPVPSMRDT